MATAQVKVWTKLIGSSEDEFAHNVTVDSSGSIYVTGDTYGNLEGQTNNGNGDAFLTKYDADGNRAWTKLIGTSQHDIGRSLANGLDGSIYVAGGTSGNLDGETNTGNYDVFLTKYDADGNRVWTKLFGTPFDEIGVSLAEGVDGSIYVTGGTLGNLDGETNTGNYDAFLTKYDVDGNRAWTKLIGTATDEIGASLATSLDGSIYVAGNNLDLEGEANGGNGGVFLTKYGADGNRAWTKLIGTGFSEGEFASGLTVDSSGSIYMTGQTYGDLDGETSRGQHDAFLTKYDANGIRVWTKLIGTSNSDGGGGLAAGLDGSIYVTGYTSGNLDGETKSGNGDAFLIKYDADGNRAWIKLIGMHGVDFGESLAIAQDGVIYLAGDTYGNLDRETNDGGYDSFLVKFQEIFANTLDVIVDLSGKILMLKGLTEIDDGGVHTLTYNGHVFNYAEVDPLITTVVRNGEFTAEFAQEIADSYPTVAGIIYNTVVSLVGVADLDNLLIAVAGADGSYVS